MNFTLNNHLKYYIGGRLYGHRQHPYEKYVVEMGSIDNAYYAKSNWLQELYRTAELITEDFNKDVNVMFSGGTDSEMVLRSLKHVGTKPNVFFIRFNNNYNETDYRDALKITDDLGFKLNVMNFDVIDFYKSGQAYELSKEVQNRQIAYLAIYFNILKLNAPTIMGGELILQKIANLQGGRWHYCFRENEDAGAMRFSLKYNIPLVFEYFSYTPEIVGYYIEHPKIQRLFTDKHNYKLSNISIKNEVSKEFMPDIICPSPKLTGYEKLMGFNQETYLNLYQGDMVSYEPSVDGIYIDELTKKLFN